MRSLDRFLPLPFLMTPSLAWRWICILSLLVVETLALTLRFDTHSLSESHVLLAVWAGYAPALVKVVLAAGAAFTIMVTLDRHALPDLRQYAEHYTWSPWLGAHLVVVGAFTRCSSVIFASDFLAHRHATLWLLCWAVCGVGALALGLMALAPPRFWRQVVRQQFAAFLGAGLVGGGIWLSGQLTQALWPPLAGATFWLARVCLGVLYSDLIVHVPERVLGTSHFQVAIDPACSGYEGIGLVTLLLLLYLWLFRSRLRFPRAWLLLPIGALAIWVANVMRITALVVLGASFSPAIAAGGFHSQAGWIAFLTVGLGLIGLVHRGQLFTTGSASPAVNDATTLAAALLAPLLVLLATMIVTTAFSSGFDWLYPVRVVAVGGTLWYFRAAYARFEWTGDQYAIGMGVGVFLVWMLLEPAADSQQTALAQGLAQLSPVSVLLWLGFRVMGSVLIVPMAEELAFRGYVIQKLSVQEFVAVRPGQVPWRAFVLSSLLFGLLHGRWVAGTAAGMGYALSLARRGRLADAVVAHMTTNALIAAYVVVYHQWALWG